MCRQSASVCLIKSPSRQHRALPGLPQRLATLADPRHRRGKRHPFVSVLLIACSAVLSGARSFAAIGQWARNAPQEALARLGARTTRCSPSASRRARRPSAGSSTAPGPCPCGVDTCSCCYAASVRVADCCS
ncbi:transposase family protein [Streptomyces sp. RB17]|uniref:transposase family protein n=1 Tax=Streptomyces sp. RB17 TaxID=2585197 RepID=UPI001E2A16E5|nr:transposase family protein [Streptomyces sp. RB17]